MADDRVLPVEEIDRAVRARSSGRRGGSSGRSTTEIGSTLGAGEAGALVLELVLEDALEADDVGDQQVALHRSGKCRLERISTPGQGRVPLLVDLRRAAVLLREVELAGEQGAVIRIGAGAVDDDVLAPAVEDVAVRVGEAVGDVDLELLRPRLIADRRRRWRCGRGGP